jgi:hypothetical protein
MQAELAAVLSDVEQASEAHAREMYVAFELPSQLSCFDALEVQWFAAPEQVERYLLGCEARLHRHRLAHLVRGVERVISRVRTILG